MKATTEDSLKRPVLRRRLAKGLLFLTLLIIPVVAFAGERAEKVEEVVRLPAGAVVKSDYFAAGERVEISGTVDGDVYAAGGRVIVDGTINGDLLAAAGTVVVTGKVRDDIRVAGGEVTIEGSVGRNLTAAGGRVALEPDSKVAGSAVVAGGEVGLLGPIGGDARVAGGRLTVADGIGGNLTAAVREVSLGSKAAVAGDLSYWSSNRVHIDPGAKVKGKIVYTDTSGKAEGFARTGAVLLAGAVLVLRVIGFVSTLAIGLFLIYLFPDFSLSTVSTLRARPMAVLGMGLLMFVLIPALSVVLAITVVGIPAALILMALYFIVLYLSKLVVIYWAGLKIMARGGKTSGKGWPFFIGLLVYTVVTIIPFAGWLASFLIMLFGLGAASLTARDGYGWVREKTVP